MKLQRVAIVLTTVGAVAGLGMSTASAATVSSAAPAMNHHDWCYAQQWRAGGSHWRQCDDVAGWWNRTEHPDHAVNRQIGPDRRH